MRGHNSLVLYAPSQNCNSRPNPLSFFVATESTVGSIVDAQITKEKVLCPQNHIQTSNLFQVSFLTLKQTLNEDGIFFATCREAEGLRTFQCLLVWRLSIGKFGVVNVSITAHGDVGPSIFKHHRRMSIMTSSRQHITCHTYSPLYKKNITMISRQCFISVYLNG